MSILVCVAYCRRTDFVHMKGLGGGSRLGARSLIWLGVEAVSMRDHVLRSGKLVDSGGASRTMEPSELEAIDDKYLVHADEDRCWKTAQPTVDPTLHLGHSAGHKCDWTILNGARKAKICNGMPDFLGMHSSL